MKDFYPKNVTRIEASKAQYRTHYFRLERMARKDLELDASDEVSPLQIAAMFIQREADWSEDTARAYRAALAFMFEELGTDEANDARQMIYHISEDGEWTIDMREKVKAERKKRQRVAPRTSAQKAKRLSMEDLDLLRAELHVSTSKYAGPTALWFMAGMLTGLRPTEWREAYIGNDSQGRKCLIVVNAKNTNGRAHGKLRTIVMAKMRAPDVQMIEDHVRSVQGFCNGDPEKFEEYYFGCRRLLSNVADRLWPRRLKHPTLYTARHMFAADVKNVFDSYGVAALMGHASTRTASSHYAPKWSTTNGGSSVEPSEGDLGRVVARNEEKEAPRIVKRQKYLEELKASRINTGKKGA